jgi:hypothetical protein
MWSNYPNPMTWWRVILVPAILDVMSPSL